MRIESRSNVRIESNRKVPQTNRLSLSVLDTDGAYNTSKYHLGSIISLTALKGRIAAGWHLK